jgi:hypothetical protein
METAQVHAAVGAQGSPTVHHDSPAIIPVLPRRVAARLLPAHTSRLLQAPRASAKVLVVRQIRSLVLRVGLGGFRRICSAHVR